MQLARTCLYQDCTTGAAGPLISSQGRFNVTSRLQRPGPHWHWCPLVRSCWRQELAQRQTGQLFAFTGSEIPPSTQIPVIFSRRIWLLEKMTWLWKRGGGEGRSREVQNASSPWHTLAGESQTNAQFKGHHPTVPTELVSYWVESCIDPNSTDELCMNANKP